ncbi:hypothetical protein DFR49_2282 [Hephaestia caeni]|uniref:Uncharacterized protein n=1 Tax=Hephaestia caeni TaxID=645617 RepID=A0A397P388_9SPHN|nr:hypothetical protein [Hephaestia caeni]RIA44046.1 hypothetical protein DFR49_2282 [Hephaestia caeni]
MQIGAVMDRVALAAPVLAGRVHSAAKLSEVMQRNQLPQVTPAAFVLPLGLQGGAADAVTGLYRQSVSHVVGVLLAVRAAGDATGAAGLATLDPLIDAVVGGIAGWTPDDDTIGVFTLSRGELLSLSAGTLTYQLDFAIEDQLRITP